MPEITRNETINHYNKLLAERDARISHLEQTLDNLCANAEPVCDSLEMGQALKSPKTLEDFRKYLDYGWSALPES